MQTPSPRLCAWKRTINKNKNSFSRTSLFWVIKCRHFTMQVIYSRGNTSAPTYPWITMFILIHSLVLVLHPHYIPLTSTFLHPTPWTALKEEAVTQSKWASCIGLSLYHNSKVSKGNQILQMSSFHAREESQYQKCCWWYHTEIKWHGLCVLRSQIRNPLRLKPPQVGPNSKKAF